MSRMDGGSAVVDALRLGLEPERVGRFVTPLTLHPETLTIRSAIKQESPLLICLHPPRLTEFQFAQRMRGLTALQAHLAFPCGLHAHEVDLGGARTVGYAWCHYTGDNPSFRESLSLAKDYVDQVTNRLIEDLPIDRRAIFLLGAEGATLFAAIHAVARSDIFAGVITISGMILPEVLTDCMPEKRRIPFLCIHRRGERMARPGEIGGRRIEDLRQMGFPVDCEILRGGFDPWEEEQTLILSWLSQKAGIPNTADKEIE